MHIEGATFLVSGGSSGLGAACVRRLIDRGARVVVADLLPPSDELPPDAADNRLFQQTDVTDEMAVRAALQLARERFGGLQGVIACAGVIHGERIVGPTGPFDLSAFRRVIDVNLIGTFNLLRLAAEEPIQNVPTTVLERGVIVMTSSIAAEDGQIGQAAYSASKGGVAALTLPAARELGKHGIRVVSIAPGVFETPLMQQVPDSYRRSLAASIPFPQRFGQPEEFAALAIHVLENPMLNGCSIRLDGGLRMPAR